VAAYPFTTLAPNLGVIERGEGERITMADIPGIIEGASQGKGLGLDFLRHIGRTRVLLYVLDGSDQPVETLRTLQAELRAYDPELLKRPSLVALNKIDLLSPEEGSRLEGELAAFGLPVLGISALSGENLEALTDTLFPSCRPRPSQPCRRPSLPPRPTTASGSRRSRRGSSRSAPRSSSASSRA